MGKKSKLPRLIETSPGSGIYTRGGVPPPAGLSKTESYPPATAATSPHPRPEGWTGKPKLPKKPESAQ